MTRERKTRVGSLLVFMAAMASSGCAKSEYLGTTSKGFWSDENLQVPPSNASRRATPFLEATWKKRCEVVRHNDEWWDKPALDHMALSGDYYYITRTSYAYDNPSDYKEYAVKVHKRTGEVIPLPPTS